MHSLSNGRWNGFLPNECLGNPPDSFIRTCTVQASREDTRCQIWIELRPAHAHLRFPFSSWREGLAGWQTTDLVFWCLGMRPASGRPPDQPHPTAARQKHMPNYCNHARLAVAREGKTSLDGDRSGLPPAIGARAMSSPHASLHCLL